jgi:hypothetical protein
VPLDREREIIGAHSGPVIDDADQAASAAVDRDVDGGGARVERVLDQLLDGGGRPLDHLARGDLIDKDRLEPPHVHGT